MGLIWKRTINSGLFFSASLRSLIDVFVWVMYRVRVWGCVWVVWGSWSFGKGGKKCRLCLKTNYYICALELCTMCAISDVLKNLVLSIILFVVCNEKKIVYY